MNKSSFHILRVGLAITFLWIGILILKSPESWGGYLQPWAFKLLPLSLSQAMISAAILDIVIGLLLLVDQLTWLAGGLAVLHLGVVITVSGITDITVRDIGLLAGAVVVLTESLPSHLNPFLKNKNY